MDYTKTDQNKNGIADGLETSGEHGDKFFDKQWHIKSLGNQANPFSKSVTILGDDYDLMEVYHNYMGFNYGNPIIIQLVDTGVDCNHEDLKDNIDFSLTRDSLSHSMGMTYETKTSDHGTKCAGIIAARAFNGKGVRGVAPFAKIAASNWISYQYAEELANVWTRNDPSGKIAISSNSWGVSFISVYTLYEDLMAYASDNLRIINGKPRGKLFIKAAGNWRDITQYIDGIPIQRHHDAAMSYASSNPYVITVAAIQNNNKHASYSSPGSNILVSGYSGNQYYNSATIATTFVSGRSAVLSNIKIVNGHLERKSDNKRTNPTWTNDYSKNYTYAMNGTSAATPGVAGILALVLEACPTLSWRDVKYLIAKHAKQIDSSNSSWHTNSAGLHHSVDYGFGLINGKGMIKDCTSNYKSLPSVSMFFQKFSSLSIPIPDNNLTGISYSFDISKDKKIEWIGLTLYSNHNHMADLELYLTSPTGTTTRLMIGNNNIGKYNKPDFPLYLSSGFRFGSVAFMGESSLGTWTVKVIDKKSNFKGNITEIKFKVMGH